MQDPRRKKLLDLRRKFKTVQRPSVWKMFAIYFPELSDRNPHTGQINWEKWGSHAEGRECDLQERLWLQSVCGYEPYWEGAPPAWYRRAANRLVRARESASLRCAIRDDELDDISPLPRKRTIRWLWW